MESETKEIISIVTIDKRETQGNSVIMEKVAFVRTFDQLLQEVKLTEICTDAHMQISALFNGRGKYKDSGVIHSLDMWHGAKNLGKKIIAAGQQRGQAVLLQWAKDICNHFWYCCKMADNYSQFIIMWTGLLHHVTNEHTWSLGACLHEPLEDDTNREWIKKESSVHITLIQIVLNKRWLKDVHKYLTFRSTSELESFNNHILITAKRNSQGAYMYHKIYNKKSRRWNLYTIKSEKTYHYIRDLQSAILETRLQSDKGMPRTRKQRTDDPRRLGPLSGVPPPTTQELLQTQISRGSGQRIPE
ncbi:hypothetical protein UPYG_G00060520 [Umbra pygmaea]|uniref:Transposase n=1 Tax=Umbra pygmaea TaxID=75934 RepID=A0ABD0XYR4_UMBPY